MEVNHFDALRIGLASPEQVYDWSYGEVKKPETINYRTLKPERDGLFCEKIFGPVKDYECHCGKFKRVRFKGITCDKCGVEVTKSKVRRERMGHIKLATAVSHIWFLKGVPCRIGLLLDMTPRALERVIYFVSYIVIDPGKTNLEKKQLLSEIEFREKIEEFGANSFKANMGAEAIKQLLKEINLEKLNDELKKDIDKSSGQKKTKLIKRHEVVDAFIKSGNKPEWMILDVVPVIPPELRPMVQLEGGRFATSDLNDLYRRVINRNNRLRRLLELGAPDVIVKNEKRMLQEAVDALIDNGRRGKPVTGPNNRPLKSLSDMLKGKQGRFRQNLLGKRVDYSGRSVIVSGPGLKLHQCGLPKEMALELFKPFVMKQLVDKEIVHNIKSAKKIVERAKPEVWDVLEDIIKNHPVLLNRAPTLHRLGIQAFMPVLIEGKAIQIHPLVCTPYNADFDGDQMAVHLPLSAGSQAEANILMLASNNLLLPSDGRPAMVPTQDMVLGIYYLTLDRTCAKGEGKYFYSDEEAVIAYESNVIELQALIYIRINGVKVKTTVGRAIFNKAISSEVEVEYINEVIDKKKIVKIVYDCHRKNGNYKTSRVLDNLKNLGFKFATQSGTTIGIEDVSIPPEKAKILSLADEQVDVVEKQHMMGLTTEEEKYNRIKEIWLDATESVSSAMIKHLDRLNPIYMMATSGARGNVAQVKQIAGMRGLMADPSGKIIPLPIKANLREGLTVLEYFISTHGARKGLADTALRTADSGYLTRRLVDVSQDVIVNEEDCGTSDSIELGSIKEKDDEFVSLRERILGRYVSEDIKHPKTGDVIVKKGHEIDEEKAEMIDGLIEKVKVRSVMSCKARYGVCRKCYGRDLATGKLVEIGVTVGVIAAQSIGEPGTQLTLRTFHTGGVASEDIISGLPRVEELFEARKPKKNAELSEIEGIVQISEEKGMRKITIRGTSSQDFREYLIPFSYRLNMKQGEHIEAGTQICEGSLNPHDILRINGVTAVRNYLVEEVQKVYRSQGVDINDKHIEVIVRQMLKKIKIDDSRDSEMLSGSLVDEVVFNEYNEKTLKLKKKPALGKVVLLGVTKASLATESFLSAASFQETTKVLTEASILGKIDNLIGLKENVIIGKLVPAGTGTDCYRNLTVKETDKAPITVETSIPLEEIY